MTGIPTPRCPLCSHLPMITLGGGTQAFCGNDSCEILTWDPSKSVDDNLTDVNFVEFNFRGDGREGGAP